MPHVLKLSADGKAAWVAFYNEWAKEQAAVEGEIAAVFAKLEAYAARFALLDHVCKYAHDDGLNDAEHLVDAESVSCGVGLVRWFANESQAYLLHAVGVQRGTRHTPPH